MPFSTLNSNLTSGMNPNEIAHVVDRAAAMDDRWLFLFALVVLAAMVLAVARYFVKQYEKLQAQHQAVMSDFLSKAAGAQAELVRVVAANTEALHGVSVELRWCKERNLAAGVGRGVPDLRPMTGGGE